MRKRTDPGRPARRRSGAPVRLVAIALGGLLAGGGCALGAGSTASAGGDDERGRSGAALFERHCAPCHGVRGRGGGPVAALLTKEPADLTRIAARRDGAFPEAAILRVIDGRDPVVAHGTRERPVWGERFGEERRGEAAASAPQAPARLLVEYLESIQRPASPGER